MLMEIETTLTIFAAFLGFGASLFFILGSIRLKNETIVDLATPRWDYHSGNARYYSEQKSFYTHGAVLLLLAFVAQALSLVPSGFNSIELPYSSNTVFLFVALSAIAIWLITFWSCNTFASRMASAANKLAQDRHEERERKRSEQKALREQGH